MPEVKKAWIWSLANIPALFIAIALGEFLASVLGYPDLGTSTPPTWVQLVVGIPTFAITFGVSIYALRVCLAAKKSAGNKALIPLILAYLALASNIWMLIGSFITISI